ncbi:MAG: insulinase family protein [Bryobacterales bacterium]|nr:insulinase family protein [Bryobacterales bacterium]
MRRFGLLFVAGALGAMDLVTLPAQSPLVTVRLVFRTGAAADPADKPGLAALTAEMIAQGGSAKRSYQERVDALFPFASEITAQVDKEMTTFSTVTHADNLEAVYQLFKEALLDPGWRAEDLSRLRDGQINALRVNIRSNNEEELGKEVLYNLIYAGHPYGRHNLGTVSGIQKITLDDLRGFYAAQYTQPGLIIGLAGGYPKGFAERVKADFAKLPAKPAGEVKLREPKHADGMQITLIEKKTRSVAISMGFPIAVKRGHPDYVALLVAQANLGQHRLSSGRLYQRMRAARGLNYGDYAYIEYFPSGMFRFEPAPNLARRQQIFQVWIRPLETPTAHFGFRLVLFELERFVKNGLTAEEFETTRSFLGKYINLLTKTKTAELGYAIDSRFYGIGEYNSYVKEGLAKLTVKQVNEAIQRHLKREDIQVVMVADKAGEWRERLLSSAPSPMKYNSPKPEDILTEDKKVQEFAVPVRAESIRIVPVDTVFE